MAEPKADASALRPPIEPLAAADEANLVLDRPGQVNAFVLVGLLAPEGFLAEKDGLGIVGLRTALRERVEASPALCRSVRVIGRRRCWVGSDPDLEQHIRLAEPVDGLEGLERMCAALMDEPLPTDRPPWELLVVPGARAPGAGMVLRIHHALADGMAAADIAQRLFDPSSPGAAESGAAGGGRSTEATRARGSVRRMFQTLRRGTVGRTMLLGHRSSTRGVALLQFDLDPLVARVRARGATVNDALLAGVASGLRAALRAAGETIPAGLPVSVPVALPRRGSAGNQVGVMIVRLPLAERDPDERLRLIATQTRQEKVMARVRGTLELMRGPFGARIMDQLARTQHLVAAFITNVRGPEVELRLAGAPLVAAWPVAVLAGNVRLGVAAISYCGRLRCGIHFDAAHVPGAAFAFALQSELNRLAS